MTDLKDLNDRYVDNFPTDRASVDLFHGSWTSTLPLEGGIGGPVALFKDARIDWLLEKVPDIQNAHVLELGPLEGAHSYRLSRAGAASVLSIEANSSAFMRCLVTKNIFNLDRVKFLLGDFELYLQKPARSFDLILASGILYHLGDPLPTLVNMTKVATSIFIWSHFFDEEAMPAGDPRRTRFDAHGYDRTFDGHTLTYHGHSYGQDPQAQTFCGGVRGRNVWLERSQVIAFFEASGFSVTVDFIQNEHQNGPACCMFLKKDDA